MRNVICFRDNFISEINFDGHWVFENCFRGKIAFEIIEKK